MRSNALALIALIALIGNAWGQTSGKVGMDIKTMPACAGYDENTGSCPVHQKAESCKVLTGDGVISATGPGRLVSVYVTGATANDDILIYDNASAASGTVILNGLNLPAGKSDFPNFPAPFVNGAYLDATLTTGNVNACYAN